jgi:UDP-N-acetyl-D-glucosamine dehydrogenase
VQEYIRNDLSQLSPRVEALLANYREKKAILGVIGLGYVGLPLSLAAARAGFKVIGFDINPERVTRINNGEAVIKHIAPEAIASSISSEKFAATNDFSRLREADVIMIAVPTPLSKQREPDLSYVVNTAKAIAKTLRPDQLIILESTTYPGTTREIMKPILEDTGLVSGRDFFLAFSPEREDPGNQKFETSTIPKVVGGDGPEASTLACAIYSEFIAKTVRVLSPDIAEAVKLTENIFRSVNIALMNELKVVYECMGISIWEVIEAAKTKPFGFMPFYPGPGLGGHCIPIDPFYLTWKAREYNISTKFIELAGEINTAMPQYVIERTALALDQTFGRGLKGSKILVVGLAYKKNIDDIRESPSLRLLQLLDARGALADYHDPFVPAVTPTREYHELLGRKSAQVADAGAYDAVIISTDHDCVDYSDIVSRAKLIVDTRNACGSRGLHSDKIFMA